MNTYATLGCTVSTFDISITYFTGESYKKYTFSINSNWTFDYENSYCCECKLLGCTVRIYVFPCGLGSYRYLKKLIKYDI